MKKHLIKLTSSCYLKSDRQIFLEENRVSIFIQHKLFVPLRKNSVGIFVLAAGKHTAVQCSLQSDQQYLVIADPRSLIFC